MKYRRPLFWLPILVLLMLLLPAVCFAAGEVVFSDKAVTLYEGEQMEAPLVIQEGLEGELKFISTNRRVAYVDENGMLMALAKGQVTITASLKTGKRTYVAKLKVTVLRQVTGMKLSTKGLNVVTEEDGAVFREAKNQIANSLYEVLPEEELEQISRVLLLKTGSSLALKVTMEPSGASDRNFTVFAAQTDVLRVSRTSVKALTPGAAMLQLTSVSNPSVSILLPVLVIRPVTKVRITAEKTTLIPGEETQTVLTVEPEDATLRTVTYSSDNEKVASVDQNGLITANGRGQTAIRVMAADGTKKVTYVTVTVVQLPETVTIGEEAPLLLNVGEKHGLEATVLPASATDKKLLWSSSDEAVATVSASGQVTAVGQGQCEILCVSQARDVARDSIRVTVVQLAKELRFVSREATLLTGQKALLRYELEPADVTDGRVAFSSSDEQVARVSEQGMVTVLAPGKATVTVRTLDGSEKESSIALTVARRPERVEIHEQGPLMLVTGRKCQVTASVWPQDSENRKIAWASTDETVASISVEGIISGKTAGECDILAVSQSDPRVMDKIHLIVRQRLKSVRFASGKETIRQGESLRTEVILEPADVPATELIYTSRDETIATVDERGVVTGVAPGRTIIRAQAQDGSGRYGQMTVTVLEAPVSIRLDTASMILAVDDRREIRASGASQTDWTSSDETVATVDENGVVTAVGQGRCEIICAARSAPNVTASASVRVVQQVTAIKAEPGEMRLQPGQQGKISWMVFPGDANNPDVIMESTDPSVAVADQKGMVTALSAGTCRIRLKAADGFGQTAEVTVQVQAPEPVIRLEITSLRLDAGGVFLAVRSSGDTAVAQLTLEAECWDIFGEPILVGGNSAQSVTYDLPLNPGEETSSDAFTWALPPEQMKNLGRIVVRLTAVRLTDGKLLRYAEGSQPRRETVSASYIGYVPQFREGTLPQRDE